MGGAFLVKNIRKGPLFTPIQATGGTVTDLNIGGVNYRYHAFTSVGNNTFNVTNTGTLGTVDYLIVAGGGSGGVCFGGAGGAGGFLEGSTSINTQNYTITVGNGGTAIFNTSSNGNKGQNSSAFGITAEGGGFGGGSCGGNGGSGGSGGGGSQNGGSGGSGNAGPPRQGFNGSVHQGSNAPDHGGGGGGAGAAATNVFGGIGKISSIVPTTLATSLNIGQVSGTNVYFSGGGSGASSQSGGRAGALGGGGRGGSGQSSAEYSAAVANTGGGGGGMVISGGAGVSGRGGSGVIVIRYRLDPPN